MRRRLNIANGNVDPIEAFWDEQPGGANGPVLCELTVENVDSFLTPGEQEASFAIIISKLRLNVLICYIKL